MEKPHAFFSKRVLVTASPVLFFFFNWYYATASTAGAVFSTDRSYHASRHSLNNTYTIGQSNDSPHEDRPASTRQS